MKKGVKYAKPVTTNTEQVGGHILPSDINKVDRSLFTIDDLQKWTPPPNRHIVWGGVLDVGHRFQIFGDEGSWKSMLALHMAYCIATGRKWLGFKTSPANVIYIQGEMGKSSVRTRSIKYCEGTRRIYLARPGDVPNELERAEAISYPTNVITHITEFFHLDEQAGIAALRKIVDTVIMNYNDLPIVVIVDPLYKVFHHDLTVGKEVNYFCENIDVMLHDYNEPRNGVSRNMAFVFIHHSRKAGVDKEGHRTHQGSEDSFGAKQISWWSDAILNSSLDEDDETKTTMNLTFSKQGRDAENALPKLIQLQWHRDTLHPLISKRYMPSLPEDALEIRSELDISQLE